MAFYTSDAKEALVVCQGLHCPLEIGDVQDRLQIENGTCNERGHWMSIIHRLCTEELGDEIHLLYSSPVELRLHNWSSGQELQRGGLMVMEIHIS